jgi:hypothetical protein
MLSKMTDPNEKTEREIEKDVEYRIEAEELRKYKQPPNEFEDDD